MAQLPMEMTPFRRGHDLPDILDIFKGHTRQGAGQDHDFRFIRCLDEAQPV